MSFSDNQNLDIPSTGQADWDSSGQGNLNILDRGFHGRFTAGQDISSGEAFIIDSAGFIQLYDAGSLDLKRPHGLSYKQVNSGAEDTFLLYGIVNSMAVFSGFIVPGQAAYIAATSPGFLVSSYSGAGYPIGMALNDDAVFVNPGGFAPYPERISDVVSGGTLVGSYWDFNVDLGHRGQVVNLNVLTSSNDAHKVRFWSGSSRVDSELLFETITTSVDGGAGDYDVNTLNYTEKVGFPFENTDTGSPGLLFGRINVQSASSVGSTEFGVTIVAERFR